jgi:hypothetical protein
VSWFRENWNNWIRKENVKHIFQHLGVGVLNSCVVWWSICEFKNTYQFFWLPFVFAGIGLGVTIGWEAHQFWGKWKLLFGVKFLDTIMDLITGNLQILVLILSYF